MNGLFNLKTLNLAITIPEFIVVLFFLFRKQTDKALFWHTIFFVTSFSNIFTEDFLFLNNITSNISFNYANYGFHGLRYSLVLTYIIIIVQNSYKKISQEVKQTTFYKLFKFLVYCTATGILLGVLGLMLLDYSFINFLQYSYYALLCLGFAWSYLYEYETSLKDDFYNIIPFILAIAVIFDFICLLTGLKQDLIVIGSCSLSAYCFILIPLLLFQKRSIPILIIVGLELYLMTAHTSGKQIYSMFILFGATVIMSFRKNVRQNIGGFNQIKILIIILLAVVGYPTLKLLMSSGAEEQEGNLEWKMRSVESLTNFFTGQGSMSDVSASPYIRVAELSNIIYEDIRNPLYLTLGRGFGGYYRDYLNLFSGYDLANGAFSMEDIMTGQFSYGHDTFVTVPMLNGFIGFFMLMSLIIAMCRKASKNYLYLSSLMFLLLWFYFDVLMGVIGVMLLFAAEHRVQKT